MNLLHFCYGIGSMTGPLFASFIVEHLVQERPVQSWHFIYLLALPLTLLILVLLAWTRFPKDSAARTERADASHGNLRLALSRPAVWGFGLVMGFCSAMEMGALNWNTLYLQDVYGLNPAAQGALFMTVFYLLYSASRLLSGFLIEKAGYMRSLIAAGLLTTVCFALGFGLGKNGIPFLALAAFPIAIIYPTLLAVSVRYFGAEASRMTGAMISIAFAFMALSQYLMGILNGVIGPAWGYRTCLVLAAVLTALLVILRKRLDIRA
jgi:fucose permease